MSRRAPRLQLAPLLAAIVLAVIAQRARAAAVAAPVTTDELHVELVATSAQKAAFEIDLAWKDACASLGAAFAPGTGPWGLGVFPRHSCALDVVDAVDDEDARKAKKATPHPWTLRIVLGKETHELELRWSGVEEEPLAKASFKAAWPVDMLADPSFARIVAARLLDQLPFLARVDAGGIELEGGELRTKVASAPEKLALPPPPRVMTLYTLAYDDEEGLWRPKAIGTAVLPKGSRGPDLRYKVTGKLPEKGTPVYALHAQGRRRYAKALDRLQRTAEADLGARIDEKKTELSFANAGALFRRSVSSGYLGLRYGHSVFQGPVIQDMSFVGVLLELRGAPFDGLRLYYDVWPEVTASVQSGAESFSGQRAVFGWSFGFDPGFLVDRIDLVPKIGLWSTTTGFLVSTGTLPPERVSFAVERALGLGLELGLERDTGWMLARGWAARDFGFNPLQKKGEPGTSVSNTRFGVDAFFEGPRFGMLGRPFNLSFLLFGFYENVSLRKTGVERTESVMIDKIEYDVGYVGGGIALSY